MEKLFIKLKAAVERMQLFLLSEPGSNINTSKKINHSPSKKSAIICGSDFYYNLAYMKQSDTVRTLIWLTLFSIAMAYLESAVVVYLRAIMYPGGFDFPLAPMSPDIALTEIFREAATIIMLLGAGYMGGRYFTVRFAWFLYCFAIWDIFYYVFLKILVGWPASLMTWDILFLIPVTWTGPVIAPVIVSLTMILLAMIIVFYDRQDATVRISGREWMLLIAGAFIVFLSFVWDYSAFMLRHYPLCEIFSVPDKYALFNLSLQYVPVHFPWILFMAGEMVILLAVGLLFRRYYRRGR